MRQETFHQKTTTLTTTLTRRTERDVVDSDVSKIGNAVLERVISVECGLCFEIFTGLLTVRGIVDSTGTRLLHFQILQNDRAHFTTEPSFRLLSFEITVSCLLCSHQRAGKSKTFISDWSTMTCRLQTNSSPPDLIPRFFGLSAASL